MILQSDGRLSTGQQRMVETASSQKNMNEFSTPHPKTHEDSIGPLRLDVEESPDF